MHSETEKIEVPYSIYSNFREFVLFTCLIRMDRLQILLAQHDDWLAFAFLLFL